MPVLGLIAATALAAAQWPTPVVADSDYPQGALLKEKSAVTTLDILVGPDGRVVKCATSGIRGDEQLAADMCDIAKRKKAVPARDGSGKPAFGYRHEFAALILPGTAQADQIGDIRAAPDLDIEVASVPAGTRTPLLVGLTVAVDKGGTATDCEYDGTALAAFGKVACQQVNGMAFDKLTDAGGSPVGYVRPLIVRFSLPTAGG